MLTRDIVMKICFCSADMVTLCADTGEAIGETLVVLVGGVLEETVAMQDAYVSKIPPCKETDSGTMYSGCGIGVVSRTQAPWWSGGKSVCRPGIECSWPSRSR